MVEHSGHMLRKSRQLFNELVDLFRAAPARELPEKHAPGLVRSGSNVFHWLTLIFSR